MWLLGTFVPPINEVLPRSPALVYIFNVLIFELKDHNKIKTGRFRNKNGEINSLHNFSTLPTYIIEAACDLYNENGLLLPLCRFQPNHHVILLLFLHNAQYLLRG